MAEEYNPQLRALAESIQRLIDKKQLAMPMLPRITTEVLALVNDERSDAASLARLIQTDQALAGHVMRIANSAAYSPNVKMASLQQAIARLGMRAIAEVAMAAAMSAKLFNVKGHEDLVSVMWRSSLATAAWAREIARYTRRNVESTFLCGLLHQIGKPVVLQVAIDVCREKGWVLSDEMVDPLLAHFETVVGMELAQNWSLPEAVIATISACGGLSYPEQHRGVAEVVLAARIIGEYMLNSEEMETRVLVGHPAIIELNLYPNDVEALLAKESEVRDIVQAIRL